MQSLSLPKKWLFDAKTRLNFALASDIDYRDYWLDFTQVCHYYLMWIF